MNKLQLKLFSEYLDRVEEFDESEISANLPEIFEMLDNNNVGIDLVVKCLKISDNLSDKYFNRLLEIALSKVKEIYDLYWIVDSLLDNYNTDFEDNKILLDYIINYDNNIITKEKAISLAKSKKHNDIMMAAESYFTDYDVIEEILNNPNIDEDILSYLLSNISNKEHIKKIINHNEMNVLALLCHLDRFGTTEVFNLIVKKIKQTNSVKILK